MAEADQRDLDLVYLVNCHRNSKWNKTAKWKRARIELLKAKQGLHCWLCNRHLLKGGKRKNRQITIEHLVARSLGGGDDLENLALCHPGCNRHLADRPLEKKQKIREKLHRETARRAVDLKARG